MEEYRQDYDGLIRIGLSHVAKELKDVGNESYEHMFELYQKLIDISKKEKSKRKRRTYLREAESLVELMEKNIKSSEELKKIIENSS
jgi:hypothetical protein